MEHMKKKRINRLIYFLKIMTKLVSKIVLVFLISKKSSTTMPKEAS